MRRSRYRDRMPSDLDAVISPKPRNSGVDHAVTAARRVISALLHAGNNSAAEMDGIADKLNDVADYLEKHAPSVSDRLVDMWSGEGLNRHNPVSGPENAIAPPLQLHVTDEGGVTGVTTLGLPYQGPPGHVHGGISALLMDHALGVANHAAGPTGMTAQLTVRYRRPTPLFEPLTVICRQVSVEGRRIRSTGAISVNGDECVQAEGLFVAKHLPRPGA
jgi:acyl-coenzyme A thioesterase PaaI-like protein